MPNILNTSNTVRNNRINTSTVSIDENTSHGNFANIGIRATGTNTTNSTMIPTQVAAGFSPIADSSGPFDNVLVGKCNNSASLQDTIICGIPNVVDLEITFPAAATTLFVSSTNANDTSAGTGAVAVLISGLDSNWKEITEVYLMQGLLPTTATTALFARINALQVISTGVDGLNNGYLYVTSSADSFTSGVPDTFIYDVIRPATNFATTGRYSVPANKDMLTSYIQFSSNASATKLIEIRFWFVVNLLGLPKIEASQVQLTSALSSFNVDTFTLPPMTDYFITCQGNNAAADEVKHALPVILKDWV